MPSPIASATAGGASRPDRRATTQARRRRVARPGCVEGVDGQVGAVRRLTLADGGDPFDERLLVLDDPGRTLTYAFTGANPFGVRRYVSTIRVSPVTDTGESFVEWWAEYDDADQEEELDRTFAQDVYGGGIAGLRKVLA